MNKNLIQPEHRETAEGNHRAAPVDPDAWFEQVFDRAESIWVRLHYGGQPKSKGKSKLVP